MSQQIRADHVFAQVGKILFQPELQKLAYQATRLLLTGRLFTKRVHLNADSKIKVAYVMMPNHNIGCKNLYIHTNAIQRLWIEK